MGCDNINRDLGELCTKFNNEIRVLKDRISRLEAKKTSEPVNGDRTKEEALVRQKCIEVEIKLRALIKRINAEAMAPKVFPDWSTGNNQYKYTIFFDTSSNAMAASHATSWLAYHSWEYCYRDFLNDALKEIGKDELVMYYRSRQ